MDFIRKVEPDYVYLCLATPYPGTALRELVKELGWNMSTEWSQYDLQTPVFENPLIANDDLLKARKEFYNNFYSPTYILRQSLKGNFYSQMMARTALNYVLWRTKLPRLIPSFLRRWYNLYFKSVPSNKLSIITSSLRSTNSLRDRIRTVPKIYFGVLFCVIELGVVVNYV